MSSYFALKLLIYEITPKIAATNRKRRNSTSLGIEKSMLTMMSHVFEQCASTTALTALLLFITKETNVIEPTEDVVLVKG